MALINGTYRLEKNENFMAVLKAGGMPDDHAQKADADKSTVTIAVDGKKIVWKYQGLKNYESTLIDGETTEEQMPVEGSALSTTKVSGNVLTVTSKSKDGAHTMERVYTFTADGLESVITLGNGIKATRIYKRV